MLVIKSGIQKILVRIANWEYPDQTASSEVYTFSGEDPEFLDRGFIFTKDLMKNLHEKEIILSQRGVWMNNPQAPAGSAAAFC